jgi:hypothetical protein
MDGRKIRLVFGRAQGAPLAFEAQEVVLEGGSVVADARAVAVHENHLWATEAARFSRFDIEQAVAATFGGDDGGAHRCGPYAHFSCVDGVAYAEQRVFAFYDEQRKDWYSHDNGRHWRRIVITPASRPDRQKP